jgi:hypothetical protein
MSIPKPLRTTNLELGDICCDCSECDSAACALGEVLLVAIGDGARLVTKDSRATRLASSSENWEINNM